MHRSQHFSSQVAFQMENTDPAPLKFNTVVAQTECLTKESICQTLGLSTCLSLAKSARKCVICLFIFFKSLEFENFNPHLLTKQRVR